MRARWVSEIINAGDGTVVDRGGSGTASVVVFSTMVASFWPGKYFLVSTSHVEGNNPLERLTLSMKTGARFEEVTMADYFSTLVWRSSRDMTLTSEVLYEQKYPNVEEAKVGHQKIVGELAQGRLKLPRPKRWGGVGAF